MLVLSRKIGRHEAFSVVEINGNKVRLGIDQRA